MNRFARPLLGTLLLSLCGLWPLPIFAGKAMVGASFAKDVYIGSSERANELGQISMNLHVGYYLLPSLALAVGFESDIESSPVDPNDRGLTASMAFFFKPLNSFSPYLKATGLLLLDPDKSVGFRLGPGLRYNLFSLLGVDNVNVAYQIMVKTIFKKANGPYTLIEWLRIGLEYRF